MSAGLLGQMVTPNSGNRLQPDVTWALDNGVVKLVGGMPTTDPDWNEGRWLATLERYADTPGCLFAVVPDVVCDAAATDERWARYAPIVADLGYTPAYVTQNGCRSVPGDAGAVFTGGDNRFKLGAAAQELAGSARRRGLWAHMGRVNSLRRLRFAFFHGYDSVDGTFLTFGPDTNLPKLLRYLTAPRHPVLFGGAS